MAEMNDSTTIADTSKSSEFNTKEPTTTEKAKTDALWSAMNDTSSTSGQKKKKFSLASLQRKGKKKKKRSHQWKDMLKPSKKKRSESAVASAAEAAKKILSAPESTAKIVNFAGKKMTVEMSASSEVPTAKKKSAIDGILDVLKDPKKISTVEKSSYDWDKFKEEKGLGEDFEKKAQHGYVSREEFINRVDWRQFNKERDIRERERVKAMKQQGKPK